MKHLATILISSLISLGLITASFNVPAKWFKLGEPKLGVSLTELTGSENLSDFPTTYNANLTALNNGKIETSTTTLPLITTLANLATVGTITSGTWNADVITVPYGGTGSSTLSQYQVLLGNGTSALTSVAGFGTSGQFLTSNGDAAAPTWQTSAIDQADDYTWTGAHSFTATTTVGASSTAPLVLNGVSYNFPSSDGSDGQAWITDGSGAITFGNFVEKLYATTTDVTVDADTSENTILSVSVPGGTLGTNNAVRAKINMYIPQTTIDTTFRVKYGATTLSTQVLANNNVAAYYGTLRVDLIADAATGAQEAVTTLSGSASALTPAGDTSTFFDMATSTASEDSTGALNLVMTAQNAGSGTSGYVYFEPVVEIIR